MPASRATSRKWRDGWGCGEAWGKAENGSFASARTRRAISRTFVIFRGAESGPRGACSLKDLASQKSMLFLELGICICVSSTQGAWVILSVSWYGSDAEVGFEIPDTAGSLPGRSRESNSRQIFGKTSKSRRCESIVGCDTCAAVYGTRRCIHGNLNEDT